MPRTAVAATTPAEQDKRFLRPADINTIRQSELREDETSVPIRFDRDVNRRYAKQLANRLPEEFLSLSQIQQAIEILKKGPPEMRQDVKINRDPAPLLESWRAAGLIVPPAERHPGHELHVGGKCELPHERRPGMLH